MKDELGERMKEFLEIGIAIGNVLRKEKNMKWTWIILLVTLTCNQQVYDMIYKAIIQQAMQSKLNKRDFDRRNDSIETLRKLCNGQKSTYEMGR